MVGPFMQGMLLLGIISWYTKGMLNMINDYYRGEFQRKLTTDSIDPKKPTLDMDNFMEYVQKTAVNDAHITFKDPSKQTNEDFECATNNDNLNRKLYEFLQITHVWEGTCKVQEYCQATNVT